MDNHNLQKYIRNLNDVYVDWGIILGLFCMVVLVLVGMSASLFFSINTDENIAEQSATAVTSSGPSSRILDTTDLTNLISIFQSKNAQMSVFTATYPGPSDPAVPMKFTAVTNTLNTLNVAHATTATKVATSTKSSGMTKSKAE